MFSKILIANRGEIACRIISTCRSLGIPNVGIYSTADQEAMHVKMADEAVPVGEASPQESYLNLERIIEAAKLTGADAIHPGYGFLSENPRFARRCEEEGICFIGPKPQVMEKMGDKIRARKLAKKAGLPVLPGSSDAIADSEAESRAWSLGFPLMVKAAEGGGGIGIHIVESMNELLPLIERTRQVAEHAFGSPRLYFERYLKNASHVEVQLIGDEHGNLLHLYERDCSVQRRNQKLIEETPSEKLSPRLRSKISKLALKLGRYIGYTNAGTVEFLVSQDEQIFFMEMNTRLQVEHGVTEMTTGVDLVELQIRSASGEPLPITQDDIIAHGHAIEARIYPEDPDTFIPQVGTIKDFHLPIGESIMVDSALCSGYEVTLHYEPLLAKVMAWGEDRSQALKRLLQALLEFRVEGVETNIPLLREILFQKEFACGAYHTGSLAEWLQGHGRSVSNHSGKGFMSLKENGKGDREIAAALGAALALSLKNSQEPASSNTETSPWRTYGRREQLLSRTLGRGGWR